MDHASGKRFVLVNGASFARAMQIHGVGASHYDVLYQILTKEIGTCAACIQCPEMIGSLRIPERTMREVCAAGFELIMPSKARPVSVEMGERVRAMDPEIVTELILVANTLGYFRDDLLAKAEAGMEIYIVSTKAMDGQRGRPLLAQADEFMIDSKPRFHFIEIGAYASRLMKVPWREEKGNGTVPHVLPHPHQGRTRMLTLTFEIPPGADPAAVERSLVRSIGNFFSREGIRDGHYTIRKTDEAGRSER